jgi:hypothetical protein
MDGKLRLSVDSEVQPSSERASGAGPLTPIAHLEHLLKVAGSVTSDANKAWAEVWGELKICTDHNGVALPEAEKGFVPKCGWPQFIEKFWMIKYYLDSTARICQKQH